jgi:hypothetical protein
MATTANNVNSTTDASQSSQSQPSAFEQRRAELVGEIGEVSNQILSSLHVSRCNGFLDR